MSSTGICATCGARLVPGTLGNRCARCLMSLGLTEPITAEALEPEATPGPKRFGDYELLEEIGRGGMGMVYRARQLSLNRIVAIKMLPARPFAAPAEEERLHLEAEVAGGLNHPNIVTIHEFGEHEGHFYFAMELVEGQNLAQLTRHHSLPPKQAARYLKTIAEAVHYAHEHGILHRDLKPSNILVDLHDQVHITDFGLAKRLGADSDLTLTGQLIGSPNYLSPEQAAGRHRDLTPRSDVYALGAVLYQLLTGRPPLIGESLQETLVWIREKEVPSPRLLNPRIPGDLETICLKCLQKEPARRYGTAKELAEDLGRFLGGEPIHARPPTLAYRFQKRVRRNKLLFAAGSVTVLALVLLAAVSIGYGMREQAQATKLQHSLAQQYLRRGQDLCGKGETAWGLHSLLRALAEVPPGSLALRQVIEENLLSWGRQSPVPLDVVDLGFGYYYIVPVPDGTRIVTGSAFDRKVKQWRLPTGAPAGPELEHPKAVPRVTVSPDGRLVLTRCEDGIARLWRAETGQLEHEFRHDQSLTAIALSHDGERVMAGATDGSTQIWSARTGQLLRRLTPGQHTSVNVVAFSPDASRVLTAGEDGVARLWDYETGQPIGLPLRHEKQIEAASFSPDGRRVATASLDHTARLWSAETGTPLGRPLRHDREVNSVAFSPDERLVLTASLDGAARLWSAATGGLLGLPMRHDDPNVNGVAFSRDGAIVLTWTYFKLVRWSVRSAGLDSQTLGERWSRAAVAFGPQGRSALVGDDVGTVTRWSTESGERSMPPMPHGSYGVWSIALSPDGQTILTAGNDPIVRLWSAQTGQPLGKPLVHPTGVRVAVFSPDGRLIATACWDGRARFWSPATGERLGPDLVHPGWVNDVAFSPDGRQLATACNDGTVRLWSVPAGELLRGLPGQRAEASAVVFSPDGTLVATGSHDRLARLWHAATGLPTGIVLEHPDGVEDLCFTSDGRQLVTAGSDGRIRFWSVETGEQTGPPLVNDATVLEVAVSPDGRRLLTGANGPARLWRLAEPLSEEQGQFYLRHARLWIEALTMMEMDASGELGWLAPDAWRTRRQQFQQLGPPPLP